MDEVTKMITEQWANFPCLGDHRCAACTFGRVAEKRKNYLAIRF